MKTILALAIVVAMLAIPTVVCAPDNNPNGNPAAIASDIIVNGIGFPDGPGFSEVGGFISFIAQQEPGAGGEIRGLSQLAPGHNV